MPDLNNSELSVNNYERRLMASCFSILGEVNEFRFNDFIISNDFDCFFREKLENKGKIKSVEKITLNYFRAINFFPFEGKYHMMLASKKLRFSL